jgi:hypothetical protein
MQNPIKSTEFFSGGNALFTVSNPQGTRYTFRIRKPKPDMPFFVSLLTGPDNESSYTYLGIYVPQIQAIRLTSKSRYTEDSLPVKVLRWAVKLPKLPEGYAIQHEGRCCRCGRTLTVPESIDAGIGPECAGLLSERRSA